MTTISLEGDYQMDNNDYNWREKAKKKAMNLTDSWLSKGQWSSCTPLKVKKSWNCPRFLFHSLPDMDFVFAQLPTGNNEQKQFEFSKKKTKL